jgi:hypothetical protein
MALIDKASLLFVPSVVAEGKAFNVLPSGNRAPDSTDQNSGYDQTRADFDFDRGSNAAATRIDSNGVLQKYRENLLVQSNNFGTTWGDDGGIIASGFEGYDGTNNAWKYTKTGQFDGTWQSGLSITGVHTISIYAKLPDGETDVNSLLFRIDYSGGNTNVVFSLTGDGVPSVGGNGIVADKINVGNGWFRCVLTLNQPTTKVNFRPSLGSSTSGTSGSIYIQSAQLESGLVATDYLDSTSVTGKAGVLVDLPRINYDANGENGSLLLEPSRQQLVPESEWFGTYSSNANGTGSLPLVYTNNATSPDGYKNATKIVFDAGSGTTTGDESQISKNIGGLTTGADYTLSFYAKGENGGEEIVARAVSGGYTKFTLTTEWKRYELTQSAASTSYAIWFGVRQGLGGIGTINSNATIWLWGVQEEAGSYPSSYIPNNGESGGVTRAADSCSVTGASDVIGQTEGTIFVDLTFDGITSENRQIFQLSDGSTNNLHFRIRNSNDLQAYGTGNFSPFDERLALTADGRYKMALGYSNGDFAYYVNGVQIATDTQSTTASNLSEIYLGINNLSSTPLGGIVQEATLFKERLSNAELATLTTL